MARLAAVVLLLALMIGCVAHTAADGVTQSIVIASKGLTDEMVTLSSTQSVSRRYHCSSFANHIPLINSSDMNPALSTSLQRQCGPDNTVVQDIVTPDDLAKSGASWQWKSKLKAAMVRMGSIGVKTSAAPPPAWPAALYVSVMYSALFGLLSMGVVLAVAAPVMLVMWTTVIVLLAFLGKPRRSLVAAGRRATADIARLALRVLLREGNAVAALCTVASFAVLLLGHRDDHTPTSS